MSLLKTLSTTVALTIAAAGLAAPALAATAVPTTADPIPVSPPVDAPDVEAQESDHIKDNRTWRQIKVNWDWTMPRGVPEGNAANIPNTPLQPVPGYQEAGNALYGPLPDGATPTYDVMLDADGTNLQGSTNKLNCTWEFATPTPTTVGPVPCTSTPTAALPEGTWDVELSVKDKKSKVTKVVSSEIEVLNVLMAVMGDSYAAGEGYPPFTNPDGTIQWDEPACERSRWSGFVRAAVIAEDADPRSNVTLVDVACSGAEILEQFGNTGVSPTGGMLSPQKKIKQPSQQSDSGPGAYMPAQVDQLTAIAQGKTYDVNMFSIGGNDAGLSPIVQSCLLFDAGSVMLNEVLAEFESQDPAITPWPGCYANGQAMVDLSGISTGNLSAECIGTSQTTFLDKFVEILGGCQDVAGYAYKPLSEVADGNLAALKTDTALMAPCLGATGGAASCQTVKIVNNAPAASFTPSDPISITSIDNTAQAMYPDLTQRGTQGNTQFCGVQDDPTQPWGGQINPNGAPFDPTKWTLGPAPLQNPLESPATQVDNAWILGHLYEGAAGRPVGIPQSSEYPNNIPRLFTPDPNDPPPPYSPETVVPQSDGLVTQMQYNSATYGWQTAMSMYEKSHPYGLCAADRWVTNLTDYFTGEVIYKGTGTGLHPNEAGYSAYAAMLGPLAVSMADLPVAGPDDSVVPRGSGVKSTIKATLVKKTVKPGTSAKLKIKVVGSVDPVPTGKVRVKAIKSTTTAIPRKTVTLNKKAKQTVVLPKRWTKIPDRRNQAKMRLRVRYLGDSEFKAATAKRLVVQIRR